MPTGQEPGEESAGWGDDGADPADPLTSAERLSDGLMSETSSAAGRASVCAEISVMDDVATPASPVGTTSNGPGSRRTERVETLVFALEDANGSWRVQLVGGVVVYEHRTGGSLLERVEAAPSERRWRQFWAAVDRIGVWSWADGYRAGEGRAQWLLQLARRDRRIQSSGIAAFPPLSAPSPSQEFLRLCAATAKLVGGILLPPH